MPGSAVYFTAKALARTAAGTAAPAARRAPSTPAGDHDVPGATRAHSSASSWQRMAAAVRHAAAGAAGRAARRRRELDRAARAG